MYLVLVFLPFMQVSPFSFRMFSTRTFTRCSLLLVIFTLVSTSLFAEFDEDNRTWQTLGFNFHETENWRFKGVAQTRLYDDSKFLGTWLVAPVVEYKLHPNLDLGAAYLLEDVRAEAGDDYTRLHIYWLYLAPHWQLTEKLKFSMRHVLAYRYIESVDDYYVSRHCFGLDYKLEDFGCLSGIGADTEVFYNYETDRICENRLRAVKATFTINSQTKFQLYFMLHSKRFGTDSSWQNATVFGQSLSYKF
jgi:hypothetical protein